MKLILPDIKPDKEAKMRILHFCYYLFCHFTWHTSFTVLLSTVLAHTHPSLCLPHSAPLSMFISIHFVFDPPRWTRAICETGFGAVCWRLVGFSEETHLKTVISLLLKSLHGHSWELKGGAVWASPLPRLLIGVVSSETSIGKYSFSGLLITIVVSILENGRSWSFPIFLFLFLSHSLFLNTPRALDNMV